MGQYLKNMPSGRARFPLPIPLPQAGEGGKVSLREFRFTGRAPRKQRGVVLFIALIALVAMTLAGIALMRSVDTANVIAGNFAFRESTLHATDVGIDAAFAALPALSATGNVPVANQYFPVMQTLDAQGVPGVTWTSVPSTTIPNTGNSYQYVVERMCTASTLDPVNGPSPANTGEITQYCITVPTASSTGGSKKSGGVTFSGSGVVYYRVTVRVTGPHGAVSMAQGTLSQ